MFFRLLQVGLVYSFLISSKVFALVYDSQGGVLPYDQAPSDEVAWAVVDSEARWSGVGALARAPRGSSPTLAQLLAVEEEVPDSDSPFMYCSGALIETGARGDAPAYVLTNGHCYGGESMAPGERMDRAVPTSDLYFLFNVNRKAILEGTVYPVRVKRIAYATMGVTDVGVLELDAKLEDLVMRGFKPLQIEARRPPLDEPVNLVGVPMDGLPAELRVLHQSRCLLGARVTTEQTRHEFGPDGWKEIVYHWPRSIRHECSMVGGNSGSPLISERTGRIVAVNNGAVEEACYPHCREVDESGVARLHVANTAQSVAEWAGCFGLEGVFGCEKAGMGGGYTRAKKPNPAALVPEVSPVALQPGPPPQVLFPLEVKRDPR